MKKILVIEDNEQNLYLVRFILDKTATKSLKPCPVTRENAWGSRTNKFTFLALRFRLGLVDFKEQKAL